MVANPDTSKTAEKKVPSYINPDAEPTAEIPEGGGVHASLGGARPYVVPTAEEVAAKTKAQEDAKAAAAAEKARLAKEAEDKAATEAHNKAAE